MSAPPDIKRANLTAWMAIATAHGPEIANRAHQAARLQRGAIYSAGQLQAVYQAAYDAGSLSEPAEEWPSPPRRGKAPQDKESSDTAPQFDPREILGSMGPEGQHGDEGFLPLDWDKK